MSKKKDGSFTGNPIWKTRIPKDEEVELNKLCKRKGFNQSECIRWALRQARENDQRE